MYVSVYSCFDAFRGVLRYCAYERRTMSDVIESVGFVMPFTAARAVRRVACDAPCGINAFASWYVVISWKLVLSVVCFAGKKLSKGAWESCRAAGVLRYI